MLWCWCLGYAGGSEQLSEDVLSYMASHPSVAKFALPDDCVVVNVSRREPVGRQDILHRITARSASWVAADTTACPLHAVTAQLAVFSPKLGVKFDCTIATTATLTDTANHHKPYWLQPPAGAGLTSMLCLDTTMRNLQQGQCNTSLVESLVQYVADPLPCAILCYRRSPIQRQARYPS